MNFIPTPHNSAGKDDIAKTVLMPGDPLRSKFIAENFLENVKLVNNVRGVQGYTGTYKGKPVTVMAHGMGNPSVGIYSYELFKFYDVDRIIRVGSIGSMQENVELKDVIIAKDCYTLTNYDNFYIKNGAGFINASEKLIEKAENTAKALNIKYHVGTVLADDTYYSREDENSEYNILNLAKKYDILGCEMESAALYINAKNLGKEALTICTVSNSILTGVEMPSIERQKGFIDMINLVLEMI